MKSSELEKLSSAAWSGSAWDRAGGPSLEPLPVQRAGSGERAAAWNSVESEAVSDGEEEDGWGGRQRRRGMKGKKKVLPTTFGTKTLGITEPVFRPDSGPVLWGSVNKFCNLLKFCLSTDEELWMLFRLKGESFLFSQKEINPAYWCQFSFKKVTSQLWLLMFSILHFPAVSSLLSLLVLFTWFPSFSTFKVSGQTQGQVLQGEMLKVAFPDWSPFLTLCIFVYLFCSSLRVSPSLSHCLEKVLPNGNTPIRRFLLYYPHFIIASARWDEGWLLC